MWSPPATAGVSLCATWTPSRETRMAWLWLANGLYGNVFTRASGTALNTSNDMWDSELREIQDRASAANELVEGITGELGQFPFDKPTDRTRLALTLLKSSIDLASASTRLLRLDPIQYGSASATLARPQLERFLRGTFFGSPALTTDEEVSAFLTKEDLPKRTHEDGQVRQVTFSFLTRMVEEQILRQAGHHVGTSGLTATLKRAMTYLNGSVHGGTIVHASYGNDMVCFDPRPFATGELLTNIVVMALLAMTQIGQIHSNYEDANRISFTARFDTVFRAYFKGADVPHPL